MVWVVFLRSSLRYLRVSGGDEIAVFGSYDDAEGAACRYGSDASVLEIA